METANSSAISTALKKTWGKQASILNGIITNRTRTCSTNSNSSCVTHPCFICDEEITYTQNKMYKRGISPELLATIIRRTFKVITVTHPIIESTLIGLLAKLSPERIMAHINLCPVCRDLMMHLSTILENKSDKEVKKSKSRTICTEEVAFTKNLLIFRMLNANKRVNLFPLPEGRIEPDRPHMYWETVMREMQSVANLDKNGVVEEITYNESSILTPFFNPGYELPQNLQQGYLTLNVVGYDYLMAPVPEHISNAEAEVQFVEEKSKPVEILPIDKETYAQLKLQAAATATPAPAKVPVSRVPLRNSGTPIIVSYTGAKPSTSLSTSAGEAASKPKQVTSLHSLPTSILPVKSCAAVPVKVGTVLSLTPEKASPINLEEKVPMSKPNALTVVDEDNTLRLKRRRANNMESKSLPVNNIAKSNGPGHGPSVITAKDTLVGSRINQDYRKRLPKNVATRRFSEYPVNATIVGMSLAKLTNLKSNNGFKPVNRVLTSPGNADGQGSEPVDSKAQPLNIAQARTTVPVLSKANSAPSFNAFKSIPVTITAALSPQKMNMTPVTLVSSANSAAMTNEEPAAKKQRISTTLNPRIEPSAAVIDDTTPIAIETKSAECPDHVTDVEPDDEIDIEYEYPTAEYHDHDIDVTDEYFEQNSFNELSREVSTSAISNSVSGVSWDENRVGVEDSEDSSHTSAPGLNLNSTEDYYENSYDQEFQDSSARDPLHDSENDVDGAEEENENVNGYHVCCFCAKQFSTKKGLDGHEWIHRRPYCALCRTFFGSMEEHRKHVSSRHDPSEPIRCFICNEEFRIESTLRVHLRFHKDQNTYSCKVGACTETFATKLEGIKHQKTCQYAPRFENLLRQKRRVRHPSQRIVSTATTFGGPPDAEDSGSSLLEPPPESSSNIQDLLSRYTDLVMDEVEPEPEPDELDYDEDSNAYESNGYTAYADELEPDYGYEEQNEQFAYGNDDEVLPQDEFEYEESETLPIEDPFACS